MTTSKAREKKANGRKIALEAFPRRGKRESGRSNSFKLPQVFCIDNSDTTPVPYPPPGEALYRIRAGHSHRRFRPASIRTLHGACSKEPRCRLVSFNQTGAAISALNWSASFCWLLPKVQARPAQWLYRKLTPGRLRFHLSESRLCFHSSYLESFSLKRPEELAIH